MHLHTQRAAEDAWGGGSLSEAAPKGCLDIEHKRAMEARPDLNARRLELNCEAPERERLIGEPESWQLLLAVTKMMRHSIRLNSRGEVTRATGLLEDGDGDGRVFTF